MLIFCDPKNSNERIYLFDLAYLNITRKEFLSDDLFYNIPALIYMESISKNNASTLQNFCGSLWTPGS